MSQLVKLEKRFENALEKLEMALANKNVEDVLENINAKEKVMKERQHNVDDLLIKIEQLEKAAKNDAEEIDKLVSNLKKILEINND